MGVRGGDANRWVKSPGGESPPRNLDHEAKAASAIHVATCVVGEVVSKGVRKIEGPVAQQVRALC
jgi:hypothetical protein